MLKIQQLKLPVAHTKEELKGKIIQMLHIQPKELIGYTILKRSLDARKDRLQYVYTVEAEVRKESAVLRRCKKEVKN